MQIKGKGEFVLNILVANDDGIQAAGIRCLVDALSEVARVYVCAPNSQRSAAGHGMTMSRPIEVEMVEYDKAEKAYAISGTPADCVKIGLYLLGKEGVTIDMVCSGVNMGGNLGTDTIYSGTVAAAVEGALNGIPAVAVSVDNHEATHFEYACELACNVCVNAYDKMSKNMVLNINTPDLPKEQIKALKFTRLGMREYEDIFQEQVGEDGKIQYLYSGERVIYEGLPDDIDVIAHQNGHATISPIHFDMTDYDYIDEIRKWGIEK